MISKLGAALKDARKRVGLTQKAAAEGICSQPMLSSIESGKYLPNADILLALSRRLSISLDELSLSTNFEIGDSDSLNSRMDALCSVHDYIALLHFLGSQAVTDSVRTQKQTQAYHYYLGVARFHTMTSAAAAVQALEMSLASAPSTRHSDALSRLALVSLGVIAARQGDAAAARTRVGAAVHALDDCAYEQNLNVLYYLAAYVSFVMEEPLQAFAWLDRAIDFIAAHDTHYMLANCYALAARLAHSSGERDKELEAARRSEFLGDLFGEKPFLPQ